MRYLASWFTLAALLFALAGCGGGNSKLHPVTGKVTFENKPATGALVVFHPKGDNTPNAIRPSGIVQDDGTYTLSSGPGSEGKGAPAGEYDVAVIWDAPPKGVPGGMGGGEAKANADRLGGRYKDAAKSGLKATVTSGPNEVPTFELK